jgi:hypothetical protein
VVDAGQGVKLVLVQNEGLSARQLVVVQAHRGLLVEPNDLST